MILGFLFLPGLGEMTGLLVALLFLLCLFVFGDKALLALVGAKRVNGRHLLTNNIKNICCRLKLKDGMYFESEVISQEILFIKMPWGQLYIVLGTKLREALSLEEQIELVRMGLQFVKKGWVQTETLITILSYPYFMFLLMLRKSEKLASLRLIFYFFMFPYILIRDLMTVKNENSSKARENKAVNIDMSLILSVALKKAALPIEDSIVRDYLFPNIIDVESYLRDDRASELLPQNEPA